MDSVGYLVRNVDGAPRRSIALMQLRRVQTVGWLALGIVALAVTAPTGDDPYLGGVDIGSRQALPVREVSILDTEAAVVQSTVPDLASVRKGPGSRPNGWSLDLGVVAALSLAALAASRIFRVCPWRHDLLARTFSANGSRAPPTFSLS